MPEVNSITVSLEWAKKLCKCGWKYQDVFVWTFVSGSVTRGSKPKWRLISNNKWSINQRFRNTSHKSRRWFLPAPTAEEILRNFPLVYIYIALDVDGYWTIEYTDAHNPTSGFRNSCRQDSLANAAAAMFVYLYENNLLPKP